MAIASLIHCRKENAAALTSVNISTQTHTLTHIYVIFNT